MTESIIWGSYLGSVVSTYFVYRMLKIFISKRLKLTQSEFINWFLLMVLTNLTILSINILGDAPKPIIFNIVLVNLVTTLVIFALNHTEPLFIKTHKVSLAYLTLVLVSFFMLRAMMEFRGMDTFSELLTKTRVSLATIECERQGQNIIANPSEYCSCLFKDDDLVKVIKKSSERNINKNFNKFMDSNLGANLVQFCTD